MTYQEDNINLGKIVLDDNKQERKSWACLGQTCSRSLIVFLSRLFVILLIIFGCFGEVSSQNFVTNQLFGLEFCAVRQTLHFTFTKAMNKSISTKNRVFISLVGPSKTGKSQLIYNWLKI